MKQMYKYLIKRLLSFIWGTNVDLSLLNHTVIPHSFFLKNSRIIFTASHHLKFLPARHECFNLPTPVQKGVTSFYSWVQRGAQPSSCLLGSPPQFTNQSSGIDTKIKPNQFALKWPIWPGSFLRGGSVRSPSMEDAGQAVVAVLKPSKTLASAWYAVTFKRT